MGADAGMAIGELVQNHKRRERKTMRESRNKMQPEISRRHPRSGRGSREKRDIITPNVCMSVCVCVAARGPLVCAPGASQLGDQRGSVAAWARGLRPRVTLLTGRRPR